jgi:hypothetical protein
LFIEDPDIPYLRKIFPRAVWRELGPSLYSYPSWYSAIGYAAPGWRYSMAVIPLEEKDRGLWERWEKANLYIQEILYESLDPQERDFHGKIQRSLLDHYGLFQGDPFLEAHYWRLVEENLVASGGTAEQVIEAVGLGAARGYPSPWAYRHLGRLLEGSGRTARAQEAFQVADKLETSIRAGKKGAP